MLKVYLQSLLPYLMFSLTGVPRLPVVVGVDFEWDNGNSRIWQLFRLYETIFWRRQGIRLEGSSWYENGKTYRKFGTWENLFVFTEYIIRQFFRGFVPKFQIVRIPQLVTSEGIFFDSPLRFAVAFDNAQNVQGSSTLSCVVTGSNGYMFACGGFSDTGGPMTGTFNSVGMTASATQIWIGASNPINGLYLAAPATGTHNLVISNNTIAASAIANTYSGVDQGTPDDYQTSTSGTSTLTATVNTATANAWMMMITIAANNTPTAGTNATGRSVNNSSAGNNSTFDSNGNITTGSFSMTCTGYQAIGSGAVAYKFKQVAASGPTNWKTYNTVTVATNLKTLNTNTLANIKTYDTIS